MGAGTRVRTWVPTGQEEWEEPVWWEGEEGESVEGGAVPRAVDGDAGRGGGVGRGGDDVGEEMGGGSGAPAVSEEEDASCSGGAAPAAEAGGEEALSDGRAAASGSEVAQEAEAVQLGGRRGVRRAREAGVGEEGGQWRVCTKSLGQVELRVAPRGEEVRLRDVKDEWVKRQRRVGVGGQSSVESGAGRARRVGWTKV